MIKDLKISSKPADQTYVMMEECVNRKEVLRKKLRLINRVVYIQIQRFWP